MSNSVHWHVSAPVLIPCQAETMTQEEMDAWEDVKKGTFEWLYDFKESEDNEVELQWKKHVAFVRKMFIENMDMAIYNTIENVRKGKWENVQPVTFFGQNVISIPIPIFQVQDEETPEVSEDVICAE